METYVHQIQFYDFKPTSFTCLSRNDFGLLACGKADGCIEIYDENQNFFMVALIPRSVCKSVQSLAWSKSRLFCTGALGQIIEVDLQSMTQKNSVLLVGAPVARCVCVFQDKIMVGNDEGYITIFSITPELAVEETLPKLSGHILSLAWSKSRPNVIATSTSQGSLWLLTFEDQSWKTETLVLPDSENPSVIWTLLFVKGILFSGDSKGSVNLWDVRVGALLHTFPAHYADVLTLAAAPNGYTVYSSGVDAIIRRFECHISEHGEDHWQPTGIIRGCRRDVHGLAFIPGHQYNPGSEQSGSDNRFEPHKLIAVGQDARLHLLACEPSEKGFGTHPMATRTLAQQVGLVRHESDPNIATVAALPFWSPSIAPTRPQPLCFVRISEQLSHNAFPEDPNALRCLALLHYPDKLTLVRLAQRSRKRKNNLGLEAMKLGPLQLAEIKPEKGATIITSNLSRCGKLVAYSDVDHTRILCVRISPSSKGSFLSVSIKPVQWLSKSSLHKSKSNGEQRATPERSVPTSRSSTNSSSETDTDTDDLSQDAVAKYFTLNSPLQSRTADLDSSLNPFSTSADAKQESNSSLMGLPAAHCLAFTSDSENLLLVTEKDGELMSVSITNGVIQWRFIPDLNTGFSFRIYQLHVSPARAQNAYLIAASCSDGRVRLYLSTSGALLFTCSCLESPVGHAPLPVCLAFGPTNSAETMKLAVLYTNGYLREWILSCCHSEVDVQSQDASDKNSNSNLVLQPELNRWLSKFSKQMNEELSRHFGVFHSMSYMDSDRWLLASYGYLVSIKANAFYEPGMIENILSKKSTTEPEPCIRVVKNFRSIMQAEAFSSNELALVSIHSPSISSNLSAPLMRKAFGT